MDNYTNLRERYRCDVALVNGTGIPSNYYSALIECEHETQQRGSCLAMSMYIAFGIKLYRPVTEGILVFSLCNLAH